ncbi:hypothetical protein UPYG_G00128140 [Umbra pygmaea]|uniref:Uncharacterized protein n=1 Tax=Umbra pygmaea TaxID=75934 RepID=A0ABD0XLR1_UMBPY
MPGGPTATIPIHQHPQMHRQTQDTLGFPREKLVQGEVKGQSLREDLKQDQGQRQVKGQGQSHIHPVDQSIDSQRPMSTPAPLGRSGEPGPSIIGHHPATIIRGLEDLVLFTTMPVCCDPEPAETGASMDQEDIKQILSVSVDAELELWTRTVDSQVFGPAPSQDNQSSDGEESSLADVEDGDDGEADNDEEEDNGEVPELPQYKEFLLSRRRRNLSRNRKALRKGLEVQPISSLIGRDSTYKAYPITKGSSLIGRDSTYKASPITKVADKDEEEIERTKVRTVSCNVE